jgi:hypothetical protein
MIGKLVLVGVARREMLREDLAAHLGGYDEALRARAAREMAGELGDHLLPHRGPHLAVDAVIGDDLGEALGERDIDEHAGAPFGGVEALRQELLDGPLVGAGAPDGLRHQREANRLPLKQQRGHEEHGKLEQVDVLDRPIGREDQGQRHGERDERRPQHHEGPITVGRARRHHDDLAARLRFGAGYGVGDDGPLLLAEGRHRSVLPAARGAAATEAPAPAGEASAIAAPAAPAPAA